MRRKKRRDNARVKLPRGSTRCLLPVHLYGQPCDMAAFRALADERGLALLEDGAQAHGAQRDDAAPGALGDAWAEARG